MSVAATRFSRSLHYSCPLERISWHTTKNGWRLTRAAANSCPDMFRARLQCGVVLLWGGTELSDASKFILGLRHRRRFEVLTAKGLTCRNKEHSFTGTTNEKKGVLDAGARQNSKMFTCKSSLLDQPCGALDERTALQPPPHAMILTLCYACTFQLATENSLRTHLLAS